VRAWRVSPTVAAIAEAEGLTNWRAVEIRFEGAA
jgi:hypothetical protein